MSDQLIADEGTLKHWRTELPNIIDDLGLDPFERTLYVHYKKVCGANNKPCEEGVRKTAEKTGMSTAKVSIVRRELARRGLVTEHEQPKQDKQIKPQIYVTIIDIWEINFFYYAYKEGRPNIAGWTVAQLREWINSVYVVNAPGDRLPDKRERLDDKHKEGDERLPGKQKNEPCLRNNHEETWGAPEKPPPLTRTLSGLPDAERQAGLIFGNGSSHPAGEQLITRAGWNIRNHDHRLAAAIFLEASNLLIPPEDTKKTRNYWLREIDTHVKTYGVEALESLYPLVISQMRGGGLSVCDPGSVTKMLGDCYAKEKERRKTELPISPPLPPSAPDPLAVAWGRVLDEVRLTVTEATFLRYLAPTELVSRENGDILVYVPRPQEQEFIEHRLAGKLKEAVAAQMGDVRISYTGVKP